MTRRVLGRLLVGWQWESAVPLEAFRRLLPDLATLLGNDYFQPVDPDTRQTRGFVKKVTVALKRNGSQKTLDVTDKVGKREAEGQP